MTTADSIPNRRSNFIFHFLGLSCIGGAILLQVVMFSSILFQGYFRGVENNPVILAFEVMLTAYGFLYFIYIYQRLIRSFKQSLTNRKK
jgi:hypothetical protein